MEEKIKYSSHYKKGTKDYNWWINFETAEDYFNKNGSLQDLLVTHPDLFSWIKGVQGVLRRNPTSYTSERLAGLKCINFQKDPGRGFYRPVLDTSHKSKKETPQQMAFRIKAIPEPERTAEEKQALKEVIQNLSNKFNQGNLSPRTAVALGIIEPSQ